MKAQYQYLLALILVICAPTVGALGYYAATGDPSIRPLAATTQSIRDFVTGSSDIVIDINWGDRANSSVSKDEVERTLRAAFASKGVSVRVNTNEISGSSRVSVSYTVGQSNFGPMPLSATPSAVKSVVAAYRMSQNS